MYINPLTIIGFHFILFCITFFTSLFFTTYNHLMVSKKTFFITIRGILLLLSISLIIQILSLYFGVNSTLMLATGFNTILVSASTGVMLFFFYLLFNIISYTKCTYKYLLEIVNILLLLLVCIQLFLISTDLIVFILTLELLTFLVLILLNISFFTDSNNLALESAVKYFIFNGFSMGLLWFASVGYYAIFKNLNLVGISTYPLFFPEFSYINEKSILLVHVIFFFSFLIKLGSGPVHFWLPDVYEGAETFITALLVIVIGPVLFTKFIFFVKLFLATTTTYTPIIKNLLLLFGVLSIVFGTIGAFSQKKIKRFLAFAGLTHFGFMLMCLSQVTLLSVAGVFFYLTVYIVTNMLFFSLLLVLQRYTAKVLIYFSQLRNIVYGNNLILYCILATILSFAGLPPFAGFFTKAIVLFILIKANLFGLVLFILSSIFINVYLYLRIIKITLFEKSSTTKNITVVTNNKTNVYAIVKSPNVSIIRWSTVNLQLFSILSLLALILVGSIFYLPNILSIFIKISEFVLISL